MPDSMALPVRSAATQQSHSHHQNGSSSPSGADDDDDDYAENINDENMTSDDVIMTRQQRPHSLGHATTSTSSNFVPDDDGWSFAHSLTFEIIQRLDRRVTLSLNRSLTRSLTHAHTLTHSLPHIRISKIEMIQSGKQSAGLL